MPGLDPGISWRNAIVHESNTDSVPIDPRVEPEDDGTELHDQESIFPAVGVTTKCRYPCQWTLPIPIQILKGNLGAQRIVAYADIGHLDARKLFGPVQKCTLSYHR